MYDTVFITSGGCIWRPRNHFQFCISRISSFSPFRVFQYCLWGHENFKNKVLDMICKLTNEREKRENWYEKCRLPSKRCLDCLNCSNCLNWTVTTDSGIWGYMAVYKRFPILQDYGNYTPPDLTAIHRSLSGFRKLWIRLYIYLSINVFI